ncbi:MAG: hypothetical protein RRA32_11190, partial [bacterium]|nr:hypothetical protein [bacterium]
NGWPVFSMVPTGTITRKCMIAGKVYFTQRAQSSQREKTDTLLIFSVFSSKRSERARGDFYPWRQAVSRRERRAHREKNI